MISGVSSALMPGKKPIKFWRKVHRSYTNSVLLSSYQPSAVFEPVEIPVQVPIEIPFECGVSCNQVQHYSRHKSVEQNLIVSEPHDSLDFINHSLDLLNDSVVPVTSFKSKLQLWAVNNKVKHTAVLSLLKILREDGRQDMLTGVVSTFNLWCIS